MGRSRSGCASSQTLRNRENADAGFPGGRGGYRVIFVGIPKSTIIGGVNAHRRIVPPAVGTRLRPSSVEQNGFSLKGAWRVSCQTGCIADRRIHGAAGNGKAQGHIPGLVHGDTAHEPVMSIPRIECAFLEERPPPARVAEFKPADGGPFFTQPPSDGEGADQGLVAAEVAVGEAEHRPFTDGVYPLGRTELPDTIEIEEAADREGVSLNVGAGDEGESGVGRGGPIYVELTHFQPVGAAVETVVFEGIEQVGGPSGRRGGAVHITGQVEIRSPGELLEGGGRSCQHIRPIKCVRGVGAFIGGHVIRVRPDPKLEVVGERTDVESVGEIGPGGVGGLGDGDAHVAGASELTQEPAVSEGVVQNDGIARVGGAVTAGP